MRSISPLQPYKLFAAALAAALLATTIPASAQTPSLAQLLAYPYVSGLTASPNGNRYAWVEDARGVRNIWSASATDPTPHQLTHSTTDDGQELTQLTFSADSSQLLYVRGGDHDENWPAAGNLAPDPDNNPSEPKITIWSVSLTDPAAAPRPLTEGDSPALSSKGDLAYVKDAQIWTAPLTPSGTSPARRLFFDHGKDDNPIWSPDGTRLAFVSNRDDHSFIGVYTTPQQPLLYLAPSTSFDQEPVWSPDSRSIAFLRQPSRGDAPENFLTQHPHPFALWSADTATGEGRKLWASPDTLAGSLPDLGETEPLFWMADNQLVFLAETDNWPHLYAVDATGGEPQLLTPGSFMVENVSVSPDHRSLIYSANTGKLPGDDDRRHLFRVAPSDRETAARAPEPLTTGTDLEWSPATLAGNRVAYVVAGAQQPAAVAMLAPPGAGHILDTGGRKNYPSATLLTPKLVSFQSPDGLTIEGQLFQSPNAPAQQPGIIFVHGGPTRQMLLGWHFMDYYCNAYAVNQYLAAHGFTVLSVNYRLGIGYGRAFQHPAHAGPAGASEYQDVLAGARYLQHVAGVDPHRIGIWGGSYGGYLTGLALARNSDVFQAGVDFHGLSNWVPALAKDGALPEHWYQADADGHQADADGHRADADWHQAIATAFAASPEADIARWTSPVLLIQGDDDRNVPFDQTVDLANQLAQQHTPVEQLVIPNEIHGFLRRADWLHADEALAQFFSKQFGTPTAAP
jgi:dipeptidyl aminopeptidase/acylaminoacyl peptidase